MTQAKKGDDVKDTNIINDAVVMCQSIPGQIIISF